MINGTKIWNSLIPMDIAKKKLRCGREIETFPDLPASIYEALLNSTRKNARKTAIIDNYDRPCSYLELQEKVDRFAAYLMFKAMVNKGDHIALMLYNSLEFCVAFLAITKLGAVTVPLPTKYKEQAVKLLIDKSDVQYIICDRDYFSWFTGYEHQGVRIIPADNAEDGYGFSAYTIFNTPRTESAGTSEDTAILMFTSGTTSQSKGVAIKNYSIMHAIAVYQKLLGITEKDKSIIPIPIYHITGLVALLGLFLYTGGTLYLHKYFNPVRVLKCIRGSNITFLHASPTIFSMLHAEAGQFPDLPSLKKMACGSSNMPREKLRQIHAWLKDSTFYTIYGLTETTSPATIFPGDAATSEYIGSSGFPIPGTRFMIRGEDGSDLPPNVIGEIRISGTVVLDSYYNLNTASLKDGWLDTGDLGYFNPEGYLFIVDRKKDMINRGGEKIWSFDVENELYRVSGISEAAVVGIPDDIYGETAAAAVKLSPSANLTEADIKQALTDKIARYMIPSRILILDDIPVTPNGKIDKFSVRKLFT